MDQAEAKIEDLLVDWELARAKSRELSAEELCAEYPELRPQVESKIKKLKAMHWAGDPESFLGDDQNQLFAPAADTVLKDTDVTVEEFVKELSGSGVLSDAELQRVSEQRRTHPSCSAKELAEQLIAQNLITPFQAKVILERGDTPLLLDRYIVLDVLGSGGMGVVFKALHQSLERIVAIKVLPKEAVNSSEKVQRFHREMRAAAKVAHPNVVQAFDAYESSGVYFLAMEYVNGHDLAKIVDRDGPLDVRQCVSIIAQVAAGLAAAHDASIVHRDVKPSNIMLDARGDAKLLDLGLAKSLGTIQSVSNDDLTKDGLPMGTITYMSPEQALDPRVADERSDIYSLGATLYFLLHGQPMFARPTSAQTLIAHRELPPPILGEGRDGVNAELEALFQQMVAKDPAGRPQSMREVHERLISCINGSAAYVPSSPARNAAPPRTESIQPGSSTRTPVAWILAAIALLIIGAGIVPTAKWMLTDSLRQFLTKAVDDGSILVEVDTPGGRLLIDDSKDLPASLASIHGLSIEIESVDQLNVLAKLPNVSRIDYWDGSNSYNYPTPNLEGIEQLPALTDLTISGGRLGKSQIDSLAKLTKLTTLDLSFCEVTTPLTDLSALTELTTLSLMGTELPEKDLEWIGQLSNLSHLDLTDTSVRTDSLSSMTGAQKLQQLYLSGLKIRGDLEVLRKFPELTELMLDGTNLTDHQISVIASLSQLKLLDISYSRVSEEGVRLAAKIESLESLSLQELPVRSAAGAISKMPSLLILDLYATDLDDAALSELAACKQLQILCVAETNVTNRAIGELQRQLPDCEFVESADEYFGVPVESY